MLEDNVEDNVDDDDDDDAIEMMTNWSGTQLSFVLCSTSTELVDCTVERR